MLTRIIKSEVSARRRPVYATGACRTEGEQGRLWNPVGARLMRPTCYMRGGKDTHTLEYDLTCLS